MPTPSASPVSLEARRRLEELAEQVEARATHGAQEYAARLAATTRHFTGALEVALNRAPLFARYREQLRAFTADFRGDMQLPHRARRRAGARASWSRWEALSRAYRPMLRQAWEEAVDPGALLSELVAVLRRREPITLREGEFGAVAVHTGEPLGRVAPPPPADFRLTHPFELRGQWTRRSHPSLLALGEADPADGQVEAESAAAEVGLCVAQSSVGSCLRLPAGFSQIRVRATLRVDWSATAESMLAPASSLVLKRIELLEVGGLVQVHSDLIGGVWVPLAWGAQDRRQGVHTVEATFPIPRAGGDFAVRAGVESHSFVGGVLGTACSDVDATVEEIAVELL